MMKKNNSSSLYLHLPFCAHICPYCDFTKLFYSKDFSERYLKALFNEIDSYRIPKMKTIYLGGGTPTSLTDSQFESLLAKVSPLLMENGEFTCEANVENLTSAKLSIMKKHGINRLSIGIQSTNNERLEEIGRHHTFEEAKAVVELARKMGFNNINVDLMYGFPGQTLQDVQEDLQKIIALNTEHVSIYSLIVSPGTMFFNKNINEQSQDDSRVFYDEILKTMREHGYKRYEISNFSKPGFESKHNLVYWHNEEYYGCGLGASGYLGDIRYTNTKNLNQYCKGEYIGEKEEITTTMNKEYFLLTHLRLEEGFSLDEYKTIFGEDFIEVNKCKIDQLIHQKLACINHGYFRFSDAGLMVMDRLILDLI